MTDTQLLLERAEAAEEGLREIALFLSCGGYNDDGPMDVNKFVKKIKEAIVGATNEAVKATEDLLWESGGFI